MAPAATSNTSDSGKRNSNADKRAVGCLWPVLHKEASGKNEMPGKDQPRSEGPTRDSALGQIEFGGFRLVAQVEQESLARSCARGVNFSFRCPAEQVRRMGSHLSYSAA